MMDYKLVGCLLQEMSDDQVSTFANNLAMLTPEASRAVMDEVAQRRREMSKSAL